MIFKEKIRIMRKELNITQQQIADILGIERSAYSYYETGKSQPPMEKLIMLSKIFNCTLDELTCNVSPEHKFKDEKSIYSNISFVSLSKDEKSLVISYRALSESNKKECMKQTQDLIRKDEA